MNLRCLIVDDEPLAREGLAGYVAEVAFLDLAATCENAIRANDLLATGEIDLLFLDIHMPKMTGLEFLRSLANPPMVVITTAYPHFALEGFELNVLDYLVKPISFDRFLKAANRARDLVAWKQRSPQSKQEDHVFVKCEQRWERVEVSELLYVEGLQNYVTLHTPSQRFVAHLTLSGIHQQLPPEQFVRIHKSIVVGVQHVKVVEAHQVQLASGQVLPVGREYRAAVMQGILGDRQLRR